MADYKEKFEQVNQKLADWLQDVKEHELTDFIEVINKAKEYVKKSEEMSEQKTDQFIDNLKFDLIEFQAKQKRDIDNSPSVDVFNESLWLALEKVTDKSQVEWAELQEDFEHQGIYQSGDFIGFGVLVCKECGHPHHHSHFSKVVDCLECGHSSFNRQPLMP